MNILLRLGITGMALASLSMALPRGEEPARHTHDPYVIKEGKCCYLFCTGPGIPIRRSSDMVRWEKIGRVFPTDVPAWAEKEVPGSTGIWAPSLSFSQGKYWLYYAVSTFGASHSVIGLACNATLDPQSPHYKWVDEGKVIASEREDNYNAIDPDRCNADPHHPVLVFGSFWSGIKLSHLDPLTGKPAPDMPLVPLAFRPGSYAIEAPCLFFHKGYYYLFLSFDYCCRGVNSTYNIRVGRAKAPEGPYSDRQDTPLMQGGGTPLLATEGNFIGPGHCCVLQADGQDYLAYHYYDGLDHGVPTLQIRPIAWDAEGWPKLGEPVH